MQALVMLAYIFWHRPYARVDRPRYEAAIVRFQRDLEAAKPPGFVGAASFAIEPVAWLGDLPGSRNGRAGLASRPLDDEVEGDRFTSCGPPLS